MEKVSKGYRNHHRGWRCAVGWELTKEEILNLLKPLVSRNKRHVLLSPSGILCITHNLNQFAKEHKLTRHVLAKVSEGKYKQHKGWTKGG